MFTIHYLIFAAIMFLSFHTFYGNENEDEQSGCKSVEVPGIFYSFYGVSLSIQVNLPRQASGNCKFYKSCLLECTSAVLFFYV